jgi:hypothetical protein
MSSSRLIPRISTGRKQTTKFGFRQQHSFPRPRALPTEHFETVTKLTNKLIDLNGRPREQWKETNSLRGAEKRLAKDVKKHGSAKAPVSAEQEQFTYGGGMGDLYDDSTESSRDANFLPGTFFEVRR